MEGAAVCAKAIAGNMSKTATNDKKSRESLPVNLDVMFVLSFVKGPVKLPFEVMCVSLLPLI